ncbi:Uncharacterised protein [Rothia kristinae]|nr:Uncharacterised protein [Rothia kristinae]
MKRIIGRLYDRGFSTFGRENTLHVSPPLTITTQELEQVLPILDEVLGWVDREMLPARRAAAKDGGLSRAGRGTGLGGCRAVGYLL